MRLSNDTRMLPSDRLFTDRLFTDDGIVATDVPWLSSEPEFVDHDPLDDLDGSIDSFLIHVTAQPHDSLVARVR